MDGDEQPPRAGFTPSAIVRLRVEVQTLTRDEAETRVDTLVDKIRNAADLYAGATAFRCALMIIVTILWKYLVDQATTGASVAKEDILRVVSLARRVRETFMLFHVMRAELDEGTLNLKVMRATLNIGRYVVRTVCLCPTFVQSGQAVSVDDGFDEVVRARNMPFSAGPMHIARLTDAFLGKDPERFAVADEAVERLAPIVLPIGVNVEVPEEVLGELAQLGALCHTGADGATVPGCVHASSKCAYSCRLCKGNEFYSCRHCHAAEGHVHELVPDRMICTSCSTEGDIARYCHNPECDSNSEALPEEERGLARYYCDVCHFHDDTPERNIFHCRDCKTCRVGRAQDFAHCSECGVCVPDALISTHRHIDAAQACHMCLNHPGAAATGAATILPCGHAVHESCVARWVNAGAALCGGDNGECASLVVDNRAFDAMRERFTDLAPEVQYDDPQRQQLHVTRMHLITKWWNRAWMYSPSARCCGRNACATYKN